MFVRTRCPAIPNAPGQLGEGISTNILAERLVRLENAGVIHKTPDPNHGRKIVYGLAEKGLDLMPIMFAIMDWSEKYDERTEVSTEFIEELRNQPKSLRREILASIQRRQECVE